MQATRLYQHTLTKGGGTEWRVQFNGARRIQWEDYKVLKQWLETNCPGKYGKSCILCTHSDYAAFTDEDDATLFYLAFA